MTRQETIDAQIVIRKQLDALSAEDKALALEPANFARKQEIQDATRALKAEFKAIGLLRPAH